MASSSQGYVYFVQAENGPIKIGWAGSPRVRLYALRGNSAVPLVELAVVPGDRTDEARTHIRFDRLRMHGEWFRPGEDLLAYIREHGQPWPTGRHRSPDRAPAEERLRRLAEPDEGRRRTALLDKHWGLMEGLGTSRAGRGERPEFVLWWRATIVQLLLSRGVSAEDIAFILEIPESSVRFWS